MSNTKTAAGYKVKAIGTIENNGTSAAIKLDPQYKNGLKQLEHFSHVIVFWWAGLLDDEMLSILETKPPYAEEKITGVFACRAPYRPNPIGMSVCKINSVDLEKAVLKIGKIDAVDGTEVIDLKAYFPCCDRVQNASIPAWLSDWPEWMPNEGIGLEY